MDRKSLRSTLLASTLLLSAPGFAGDFDGTKNLICAPVEVMDCMPSFECLKGTPEDIGAPAFMRVDFKQKAVIGPKRTSEIQLLEQGEGQILLRGTEFGYGWTMALDRETGRLVGTLTSRSGVYVLFGSCTPL